MKFFTDNAMHFDKSLYAKNGQHIFVKKYDEKYKNSERQFTGFPPPPSDVVWATRIIHGPFDQFRTFTIVVNDIPRHILCTNYANCVYRNKYKT